MLKFIAYRLLQLPLILGVIYLFTFFMVWVVPGDPFSSDTRKLSKVELDRVKRELHADTWYHFLGHYTTNLITKGDFGPSLQRPAFRISEIVAPRLVVSVQIGMTALTIAAVGGMLIGTVAAVKRNGPLDWAGTAITMVGISLPSFVIASLLMLVFVANLQLFSIGEWDAVGSLLAVTTRIGLLVIVGLACLLADRPLLRVVTLLTAAMIALSWTTPDLNVWSRWLVAIGLVVWSASTPTKPVLRAVLFFLVLAPIGTQIVHDVENSLFTTARLGVRQLALPAIALSLAPMAYIVRLQRSSMLDVLGADYVRTARAKGVSRWRTVTRHCMRNAFLPVLSYLGPAAAVTLTGSFIVETIFDVEGLGRQFVASITNRDQTLILALVLIYSTLLLVLNLLVDVLYAVVDPRIDVTGRPA